MHREAHPLGSGPRGIQVMENRLVVVYLLAIFFPRGSKNLRTAEQRGGGYQHSASSGRFLTKEIIRNDSHP